MPLATLASFSIEYSIPLGTGSSVELRYSSHQFVVFKHSDRLGKVGGRNVHFKGRHSMSVQTQPEMIKGLFGF